MIRSVSILLLVSFAMVGCGDSSATPHHNSLEDKLVKESNNLTPEQQIERAEKSPMPEAQKASLIKSIKDKNNLK